MADIRVMLVDDHPVVRQGIRLLLDQSAGIEVVAETETGGDALALAVQESPDVLLLDLELPDMRGVDVIRELAEKAPELSILVLSSYDDRTYISEVLAAGANGYLIKEEAPDEIVEAVRGVARGEKGWMSRKIASKVSTIMEDEEQGVKDLTPRELEVLTLVVEGMTNAEIGYDLGISEKTVEKHLDGVYRKLKVGSRVEAAVLAVREGLVEEN